MSEQNVQTTEGVARAQITKGQVIAAGGTLLASGLLDIAMHGDPLYIGLGLIAAMSAGAIAPSIEEALFPGPSADEVVEATSAVVDQLHMNDNSDLPQDFRSKMRRLIHVDKPDEIRAAMTSPSKPKDEKIRPEIPGNRKPTPGAQRLAIPAAFLLDGILADVQRMNEDGYVYFGRGGIDQAAKLSLMDMYNIFDVSASGSGKSNRFRLAMMQLVDSCEVYYVNPFANKVKVVTDSRKVEVWAPIFERLANGRPMKTAEEIKQLMQALLDEIQERSDQEARDDFAWRDYPIFAFIDELPEVYARCGKDAPGMLDRIVRTGRQFGVFTWVASQSGAVEDIGLSMSCQGQFKTRIYGGGSTRTSNGLMKGPVPAEDEETLHLTKKGLTLMLAEGLTKRQFVRAPLVSNEALFAYFGLEFNLSDWYSETRRSSGRRSNVARIISNPTATEQTTSALGGQEQRRQPQAPIAPTQERPTTLDAIMRLYQDNKIDVTMFCKLVDALPDNQSRPVEKSTSEDVELSSQSANLRLVPSQRGTIPADIEHGRDEPVERIPAMSELPPLLGKDDYQFSDEQVQDFLRRYRKTPNIHSCLAQMVNSKGEIGISKRYYKHAAWLVSQQQQRERM